MGKLRQRLSRLLLIPLLLGGCTLFGSEPTPIPWRTTNTPPATGDPQAATSPTPETSSTPTATPLPATETPVVTPTLPPGEQVITLDAPTDGRVVENPVQIRGRARVMPFEGTLVIRVYDALDQLAAEKPIIAEGELDGPATFEATLAYGGVPGEGRIEVLEFSARDGSIVGQAAVDVTLAGFPGGGYVEQPAPLSDVTRPVKLLARVARPEQEVDVTLSWDDGTQFTRTLTTLEGLDGRGLLIVSLDEATPELPDPPTQAGAIEIRTVDGSPLAYQPVRILNPNDPDTMDVQVYWIDSADELVPQTLRVPQTQAIGGAALEALLWGPVPGNTEGYETAIPTPEDVLDYPGRGPEWGERVELRRLTIDDGTAHADFSLELGAHSGGALQVTLIREQIEATLLQFSTVDEVVISINGITGVLEP